MAATARLIVMMDPGEKTSLEAQAEAANVSTAEFVRRRLFGRGAPEEAAFFQMLGELEPVVRRAARTIDANLSDIRSLRESGVERDGHIAEAARSSLTPDELSGIADRLDLSSQQPRSRRHFHR